jgi:large subunit ribosomal protein L17
MRHRRDVKKLSRKRDHRISLLKNLSATFAMHGKLTTTTTKAKAFVRFYEHLISLAKRRKESFYPIRVAKKFLFSVPAQRAFVARLKDIKGNSGFLRLTKMGFRKGDAAETTLVELKNN